MKLTLKEIGRIFHIISIDTESRYNQSRCMWIRLYMVLIDKM